MPLIREGLAAPLGLSWPGPRGAIVKYHLGMVHFLPLDVPQTCPSTSEANLIAVGPTVWLAYYVGPLDPARPAYAVVRFEECMNLLSGAPNDDARHNLPLRPPWYGAFEAVGSPWLKERGEIAHRERVFDPSKSSL